MRKELFFIQHLGSHSLLDDGATPVISRRFPAPHSLQRERALNSLTKLFNYTVLLISTPPWSIHPRLGCVFCKGPHPSMNVHLPPPPHLLIYIENGTYSAKNATGKVVNHHMPVLNCIVLHCITLCDCNSEGQRLCLPCPDYCSAQGTWMAL